MSDWVDVTPKKKSGDWVDVHPSQAPPPIRLDPQHPLGRTMINLPTPNGEKPALWAVLERLGQIIPAGIARGPGAALNAAIHGTGDKQYLQDVLKAGQIPPREVQTDPQKIFGAEMAMDPTSFLGESGALEKLSTIGQEHWLPLIMAMAKRVAKPNILGKDPLWVRAASWLHDQMTPGGEPVANAIRKEAEKHGAEGVRQMDRAQSVGAGGQAMGAQFTASLKQLRDKSIKGLTPEEESRVYLAIHKGTIDKLPERLQANAKALQAVDRSIPYVFGSGSLRTRMTGQMGYGLPRGLELFDVEKPRGMLSHRDFMENHVPTAHGLSDEEAEQALQNLRSRGGKRALTDIRNRFFQQRAQDPGDEYFKDLPLVREMWDRSFEAAGRQMQGAVTRQGLLDVFSKGPTSGRLAGPKTLLKNEDISKAEGPPGITKAAGKPTTAAMKRTVPGYVQRAFGAKPSVEPSVVQEIAEKGENAAQVGKSVLFTTPFPHQRNITTEMLLAQPQALPLALSNYLRMGLGFAKPTTKGKVIGEAMKAGATGMPNVERQHDIAGLMDAAANGLSSRLGIVGRAASVIPKVISAVYRTSGKMLWTWDEASKAALQTFAKQRFGGDKYRAAAYVRKHLVDYGLTSPAQDALRFAFPFSTWRTRMPQAILLSMLEHPEYAIGLDRATHGAAAGAPFNVPWSNKKQTSSNPMSEAGELIPGGGEMHKYLRSSLSLSAQIAADLAAKAQGEKELPYPASSLEARIPGIGQAMQAAGKSPYGDSQTEALMYLLTGIHPAASKGSTRKHYPPRPHL